MAFSDLQCWVPGYCLGISVHGLPDTSDIECRDACRKDANCIWFTHNRDDGHCNLMQTCDTVDEDICPTCTSGHKACGLAGRRGGNCSWF